MRQIGLLLSMLLLPNCNCSGPILALVANFVRVEPGQIDFGRLVVRTIEVINSGRTSVEGTWSLSGESFLSDDANPSRAAVGSTLMSIRCAPRAVGTFDGQLKVALPAFQPIVVPLAGEGVADPECVPSGPCHVTAWDLAAGRYASTNGAGLPGGRRAQRELQRRPL